MRATSNSENSSGSYVLGLNQNQVLDIEMSFVVSGQFQFAFTRGLLG